MILTWTKEPPSKPGYYFTRSGPFYPTVIHLNAEGEILMMGNPHTKHASYYTDDGRQWAGPIPEPTNMTATEITGIFREQEEKAKAARHTRIRDLAERMAVASLSNPAASPIDDGGKKLARSAIVVASAVVSECERRERGE